MSGIAPGTTTTTNAHNTASYVNALTTPPELEQTLALLSAHRTVLGYLLLARPTLSASSPDTSAHLSPVSLKIIRHAGVVFDGEQGRKYAAAVARIVDTVRVGLDDVSVEGADPVRLCEPNPLSQLTFFLCLRMRFALCASVQRGTNS